MHHCTPRGLTRSFDVNPQAMPRILPVPRGRHKLRFSYSQWEPVYEASIELPDSPFAEKALKIVVEAATAWELVTDEEVALIDQALDWLPDLLPVITSRLQEYSAGVQDPKLFREAFRRASIYLGERGEHSKESWTFVVESLAFEGDNWGVHFKFVGDELQDVFAGD